VSHHSFVCSRHTSEPSIQSLGNLSCMALPYHLCFFSSLIRSLCTLFKGSHCSFFCTLHLLEPSIQSPGNVSRMAPLHHLCFFFQSNLVTSRPLQRFLSVTLQLRLQLPLIRIQHTLPWEHISHSSALSYWFFSSLIWSPCAFFKGS
jgi:hypothetical protein